MMVASRDLFPVAHGLDGVVGSFIGALVAGLPNDLLDQVTPTTAELLKYWFQQDHCDLRFLNFHRGQRDAILNVIYAHEVVCTKTLLDLYEAVAGEALLDGGVLGEVSAARNAHPKYCAKMATGTGKTWVLNALLIWQYLNHIAEPADERFTSNFLIVTPGLIVYDRMLDSFLGKEIDGERNFATSDIYAQRDLFVPKDRREQVFGFLQTSVTTKADIGRKVTGAGMIAITNWHLLAGQEDPDFVDENDTIAPGQDIDPKTAVESIFALTPGTTAGHTLEALDRRFLRGGPLESLKDLPDLMVFNDEAHHIHDIKTEAEATEVEWQKSLTEIASTKGSRFIQMDFSATPYEQVGKQATRRYFPHIVVDFDLKTAMRAGLVKALALDKRKEVAALPLDFKAERDEQRRVIGLSHGQRVMLRAGLTKLRILEDQFAGTDLDKHPKLMVICEDTNTSPLVEEFLWSQGLAKDEVLRVDSGRKGEMTATKWESVRERLFDIDRHREPRVIVSVLMLREGFDVNNISVIVPLRASNAPILLEQMIGRGLRLMWRGNDEIDELKRETRERIAKHQEPNNYFDVLFIVEHPAFSDFYDELVDDGLAIKVGDDADKTRATGDLEQVELRPGYRIYDFDIPIIIREGSSELTPPSLDPMTLPHCLYPLDMLLKQVGKGDRFFSEDQETKSQYGDYRVDGGVLTATGYNDYLSRMTNRISAAMGRSITKSAKQYAQYSQYPVLQTYLPYLTGWLDTYIRGRLFGGQYDPLEAENWRVLLIDDVAHHIAGVFAQKLTELENGDLGIEAVLRHYLLSEVQAIPVRSSSSIDVIKCIYPRLPIPTSGGGLERLFIEWLDQDSRVEAFVKIHEYRHDYLRRPYLKADGMPAQYSPDFLVRTDEDIYVVETKADSGLSDENVKRKKRAALDWCERINRLPATDRLDLSWNYVLLGETLVKDWRSKNARASELLDYARIRRNDGDLQGSLL